MTLTKAILVEKLIEERRLDRHDARSLVDQFFEEIRSALAQGEAVKLSGFGQFELRDKNPRPGRNPKTGEVWPVEARRVVTFKPGTALKDQVARFEGNQGESAESKSDTGSRRPISRSLSPLPKHP